MVCVGRRWALSNVVCCAVLRRGVLNIVHGTHDTVNRILDHPDIAAVSFVGGDKAGRYIYERAAANGKRVQVRARVQHDSQQQHRGRVSCQLGRKHARFLFCLYGVMLCAAVVFVVLARPCQAGRMSGNLTTRLWPAHNAFEAMVVPLSCP